MKTSNYELHIQSTIGELLLYESAVDIDINLDQILDLFIQNQDLPGVILTQNGKYHGFISRRKLYENISVPFGLELYSKRSLIFFYEDLERKHVLVLPSSMLITDAMQKALERSSKEIDDVIIIEFENGQPKMLDTHMLILAYSQINSIILKRLNEANEFKTDLLSMSAHDLKSPLNNLIMLSKTAKGLINLDQEEVGEMLTMIHDTSKQMVSIIEELLNSTVIESGKIQLKKHVFDLGELINVIIYQNRPVADNKYQIIDQQYDINDKYITYGDSLKIREAIENLVSNAIKYSPHEARITISLTHGNGSIKFSVKDEGPGLTPDDMQKLFGKFQRLSAQPTGGESSTGLGLFISRQIVELHNGNIYCESTPGAGATFFIDLPVENIDLDDDLAG